MFYEIVEIMLLVLVFIIQLVQIHFRARNRRKDEDDGSVQDASYEPCGCDNYDCSCISEYNPSSTLYVVCVCTRVKNGQRVYKSFTTNDYSRSSLSTNDLDRMREDILANYPEFKDCVILSFDTIRI